MLQQTECVYVFFSLWLILEKPSRTTGSDVEPEYEFNIDTQEAQTGSAGCRRNTGWLEKDETVKKWR